MTFDALLANLRHALIN